MAAKFQAKIPEAALNSGHQMPVVGFGLGASSVLPLDELVPIIIHAMEIGCRHFDTAAVYGTEEALGKAVAKALATGLIKTRDELFITSKLWITDGHPDLVLPALKKSLATMELEYLDLYLIHFPVRAEKDGDKLAYLPLDIQGTWEAMEGCSKLGLTKSIGLSNFTCEKISKLLENASIPPAINQVEMNVGWQQRKLLPFCKEKGIQVCAWSPLGGSGSPWGSNAVMENETLKAIATSKCKTIAQVALRWLYEQGVGIIVRSFNKERIKQNLEIFDWELTDEERARILLIPQRRVATAEFVLPGGQSVEEFWDGDV